MLRCQKFGLQTAASRGLLAIACVNALYPDQALFIRLALQGTLCRALMLGLVTSRLSLLGFEGPGDSWWAYKQHAMKSPNKVLASLVCPEHSISILGWLLTDWKDERQPECSHAGRNHCCLTGLKEGVFLGTGPTPISTVLMKRPPLLMLTLTFVLRLHYTMISKYRPVELGFETTWAMSQYIMSLFRLRLPSYVLKAT